MDPVIRHRGAVLALLAPAIALLALVLAGCTNPFQPARPELPKGAIVAEDFSSPDSLLATIVRAINAKSSGRTAYNDAIADSTGTATPAFYAFPDPAVLDDWTRTAQGLSAPDPWDRKLELKCFDYVGNILPQFSYYFVFEPDNTSPSDQIDLVGGTAYVHRHYFLLASSSASASQSVEKIIAIGYCDLSLRRVVGRWVLYLWNDRVDPTPGIGVNPTDPDNRSMGRIRLDSSTSN